MKNYTVYIEQDEDGVFVGSVPTIPGCYTQGATIDELLLNLKEVVALCVRNQDTSEHSRFIGVQNIEIVV
jgi:predicted RNase H-like HicB family nuclease